MKTIAGSENFNRLGNYVDSTRSLEERHKMLLDLQSRLEGNFGSDFRGFSVDIMDSAVVLNLAIHNKCTNHLHRDDVLALEREFRRAVDELVTELEEAAENMPLPELKEL